MKVYDQYMRLEADGGAGSAGGGGAGTSTYEHQQTVPAGVWTVNHRLGRTPAAVTVWVGDVRSFARIERVNDDRVLVKFNSNQSGRVEVV